MSVTLNVKREINQIRNAVCTTTVPANPRNSSRWLGFMGEGYPFYSRIAIVCSVTIIPANPRNSSRWLGFMGEGYPF
jgi:hypothetical protein